MKKSYLLAALALTLTIADALLAQDKAEKPEAPKEKTVVGAKGIAIPVPMIKIPGVEWTDEQKKKITEFQKELTSKFAESYKKLEAMLTDEQKRARREAIDTAKAAGKKPQEIMEAARAAVKFTDDQKKQIEQLQEDMKAAQKEFSQKVMGLLTPYQKRQFIEKLDEMQKTKPAPPDGKKSEK
jgi:hypothetical protein